jgi:hypothetical protein
MDTPPAAAHDQIVEYLAREAPWELERFRSLDALVASGSEWADESTRSACPSYSSWLRGLFSLFRDGRRGRAGGMTGRLTVDLVPLR